MVRTARLLGDGHDIIMSFDVKSENFNIIKFPEGRSRKLHMIPYEGRLALVTHDYHVVKLYILEDAHGHEWRRELFVLHLPCENLRRDCIRFRGITDAGLGLLLLQLWAALTTTNIELHVLADNSRDADA
ncbi:hypothetical protein F2Q69_00008254 [Brassica cretica]|uniref:F-box associated beta-propeller type 3 domain-containing protein n=1 Tax=Brassica cretica TaxID=69181 RepID=A0A8S9PD60_BRACR|nr:hypothetical protein F2Q69_00008254 [Brassica cretica]